MVKKKRLYNKNKKSGATYFQLFPLSLAAAVTSCHVPVQMEKSLNYKPSCKLFLVELWYVCVCVCVCVMYALGFLAIASVCISCQQIRGAIHVCHNSLH